jgi:hypothetical protein
VKEEMIASLNEKFESLKHQLDAVGRHEDCHEKIKSL